MEDKNEILKRYALGVTKGTETDIARLYLSDNFELIFDVIKIMRNNALNELNISLESDPIAELLSNVNDQATPSKAPVKSASCIKISSSSVINSHYERSMKDVLISALLGDCKKE